MQDFSQHMCDIVVSHAGYMAWGKVEGPGFQGVEGTSQHVRLEHRTASHRSGSGVAIIDRSALPHPFLEV